MKRKSTFSLFILTASSFIGGVGVGLLLAPDNGQRNRKWITDRISTFTKWIDQKGHETYKKGEQQLHLLQNHVVKGYRSNIPDLYKATEHIDLEATKPVRG